MFEHCGAEKHGQEQGMPGYGDPDVGLWETGYTAQVQEDMGVVFQSTPKLEN